MSTLYVDRRNVRLDSDGEALVFHENGLFHADHLVA